MALEYTPADPAVRANPYPQLRRLRDEDPVHWAPGLKSWVLTRYDDVQRALASPEMSPNRLTPFYESLPDKSRQVLAEAMRYLNLWIVFRDPPEHTRLRMLVNKAFLPGTINSFRPEIERIVDELVDGLGGSEPIDLVSRFTVQLPARVIMGMLGVPREHLTDIKSWSDDIMQFLFSARDVPDKYERAQRGAIAMSGLFREIIASRRVTIGSDLLSHLILARDADDSLTEDELVATSMLLLFAGHETTTNLLSNATVMLLRNPEERARFLASPELAGTAIEEFLRYDGPSNSMSRVVRVEHEVGGRRLQVGDRVFAMINAANHDERQFTDPDRLDIGRQPNRHLTFGQGIHFCLGAQLARLEARVALPRLHGRFPAMTLADPSPVWHDSLIARGMRSLHVRLEPMSA
jgi:cytochrome P450